MSILIKGMDMPKDDCNAVRQITIENVYVDGHIQILVHDLQTGEFIGEAIEIPKHGRLIDADELVQSVQVRFWGSARDVDINKALTVIEAEE